MPGVLRSLRFFSFAAAGPKAAYITSDPLPLPPHIPESPVGRVHELNGKFCFSAFVTTPIRLFTWRRFSQESPTVFRNTAPFSGKGALCGSITWRTTTVAHSTSAAPQRFQTEPQAQRFPAERVGCERAAAPVHSNARFLPRPVRVPRSPPTLVAHHVPESHGSRPACASRTLRQRGSPGTHPTRSAGKRCAALLHCGRPSAVSAVTSFTSMIEVRKVYQRRRSPRKHSNRAALENQAHRIYLGSAMALRTGNYRHFPTRVFIGAVAVVCLALAVSAVTSFTSMMELRKLYLDDRAHEISAMLVERVRGPDRLDPDAWRELMDETIESGSYPWLKHLALVDLNGQELTTSGRESSDLYVYETAIRTPRRARQGWRFGTPGPRQQPDGDQPARLNLKIGLDPSSAQFIARRAYLHLGISALAIFALGLMGYFFVRTLRSFLVLQSEQESQRRLAALGQLSATLAHEIRNPLGAIKGLTQVAQERLPAAHDTQQLMTTVVSEAERLERLITDLLAFARPRPISPVELDLKQLVAGVAEELHNQASRKKIDFRLPDPDPPAPVQADPDGLRQVFLNLFLNAIEATPASSSVEVRIETSGQSYLVEIADQGTGIGDQDPEELFQPFVTTKTRGTGLGLPVSRQIVERLGGTINIRNGKPRGAVCRITLPARKFLPPVPKAVAGAAGG
jgi:signal transduction histidine kinase